MGDRVSVTISVPTVLADATEALIEKYDGNYTEVEEFTLSTDYGFDEVNYGNLECEQHLTAAGIAWIKSWGAGGGFTAGTAWAMFREDGSLHAGEFGDASPEEVLREFFNLIDQPQNLADALRAKRDEITSPSWENQVEYGKRYLAVNLINPPPSQLKLSI